MDRIHNPIQDSYVTFVTTAAESDGALTTLDMELAPGPSHAEHYHDSFTEHIEVLDGRLKVEVNGVTRTLHRGNRTSIGRDTPHRLHNPTDTPIKFRVEMRPGHRGFEHMLRIHYGLANEGTVSDNGQPTSLIQRAVLADIGGTVYTDTSAALRWSFYLLATLPNAQKMKADLKRRFVPEPTA